MRVKLVNLNLVDGGPKQDEAVVENGEVVLVNPIGRRRRRSRFVQPGNQRVLAALAVLDERGFVDDCGCDFEFWLDELPKGSTLGSEFDLDVKPVKR